MPLHGRHSLASMLLVVGYKLLVSVRRAGFASLVSKLRHENEARERQLQELSEESDQLVRGNQQWGKGVVKGERSGEVLLTPHTCTSSLPPQGHQAVDWQQDMVNARRYEATREQRLARAQEEVQQLQTKLAALPEVEPPTADAVRDGNGG
ncbi:unnamed protein product [Closterium sp. Naga37s-1]|nr:unnamed protein product [Closterium sp. Naga37s-1]